MTKELTCKECGKNVKEHSYFVHGKTINGDAKLMCARCHDKIGIGLGQGKGRMYDSKTRWEI